MQAWKLTYSNAKDPGQRYIIGICATTREDAIETIKRFATFAFNVERTDYLGEIHVLSTLAENKIIDYYKQTTSTLPSDYVAPSSFIETPLDTELDKTKEESKEESKEDSTLARSSEVECQFCALVCKSENSLLMHEKNCAKNPANIKKSNKKV